MRSKIRYLLPSLLLGCSSPTNTMPGPHPRDGAQPHQRPAHEHGDHAGHGDHDHGEHAGHSHGDHAGHAHGEHAGHSHGDQAGHSHGDHAHGAGGPLGHRFENAEEWAKRFDDPARDAWQKPAEVIAAMKLIDGMTVADLGAGTGYFEPHLSRAVGTKGQVIALDVEPDMVRYLRERASREKLHNVEAKKAELDDPKLPSSSVDRILIVDAWHHIAERPAYVAKLKTALRPGGAVYIVDYTLEAAQGPPKQLRIRPEQVVDELKAGGLTPEVLQESLPDQYIVVGHRR